MNHTHLNSSHYSPQGYANAHGTPSAYSLSTPTPYAHLQHYHHPYSVRLQHSLDYSRETPSWGYYESHNSHSAGEFHNQSIGHNSTTPRTSKRSSPSSLSSSTNSSRKSSPEVPGNNHRPIGTEGSIGGGGGVAVATPVPVRVAPIGQHKITTPTSVSDSEELETHWKASPNQEVPECPEYTSFASVPYPHTTTKSSLFSFEGHDQRDAYTSLQDHHVPSGPADPRDTPWGYSHAFVR